MSKSQPMKKYISNTKKAFIIDDRILYYKLYFFYFQLNSNQPQRNENPKEMLDASWCTIYDASWWTIHDASWWTIHDASWCTIHDASWCTIHSSVDCVIASCCIRVFLFPIQKLHFPETVKFKSNPMEAHHIIYSSCSNSYSCCIALKRKDLAIDDLLLDCFKQFSLPNIFTSPSILWISLPFSLCN